ncbi:hypothetical protein [Sphingomonas sp.]|uniref:hypothetical protein n=1 Tax=Sphingomonas sp. TaxID=28214 RepID=UPI0035BC1722
MERYTIEVREDAVPFLHEAAEAKGVSVEEEIGRLVQRTYAKRAEDDWVHELIAMSRPGVDFEIPRMPYDRQDVFAFDDFD